MFTTLDFFLLFSVCFFLYFSIPKRFQNYCLLLFSLLFYIFYGRSAIIFLILSTIITYYLALEIDKNISTDNKKTKLLLVLGIVMSLGVLAYYKYLVFFGNIIFSFLNIPFDGSNQLKAPLGISFIVFTLISYMVDVYKGKVNAERNFIKYALYISFFPKVVQGPIERAKDILPQFDQEHHFDLIRYREGMIMALYGLFMKMVVADTASIVVNKIYGSLYDYSGAAICLATIIFAVQIYCDFAGYSYISIGIARVLGFDFSPNFTQPYLSISITEFWKRWHMSLNRWLTDYVYIPLGGNRCSKIHKYFNILVTFVLSGLWHGAYSGYVFWGFLNGLYIAVENIIRDFTSGKKQNSEKSKPYNIVKNVVRRVTTFILICFSWVFFRAKDIAIAAVVIKRIILSFNFRPFINYVLEQFAKGDGTLYGLNTRITIPVFIVCIIIVIIIDLICNKHNLVSKIAHGKRVWRWAICFVLIFMIILFGVYGYGYNSSDFIYGNF